MNIRNGRDYSSLEPIDVYRKALRIFWESTSKVMPDVFREAAGDRKKRLGIDVHGVITEHPEFLAEECRKLVNAGHEIHIMTGSRFGIEMEKQLGSYGFEKGRNYTHFFSVTDHLIETGVTVTFENGLPYADAFAWNTAKGEYAYLRGLDCVWDDSPVYCRYMPEGCWYFTYSKEYFVKQVDQVVNGTRPRIGRK